MREHLLPYSRLDLLFASALVLTTPTEHRRCNRRRRWKPLLRNFGFAGLFLLLPLAQAQAPALYWTHIEMGSPEHCGGVNWCPNVAFGVLSKQGFNPKRDGTVGAFGSNHDTTVVVQCTPVGGGRVIAGIFAASATVHIADDTKNRVAQQMRGAGCL